MGYGSRKAFALIGVLLFLLLSSCGAARREVVNFAIEQAQLGFTGGDFQRALDIYKGAYQKYPDDSVLLVNYIKTLEQMKSHGEKAFARKDFVLAGSTYDILLRNYPQFADFAHSLSFDADFLETKIKTSRNFLIEREAQPYLEEGDFQKAIDVYQGAYQKYPEDSVLLVNYMKTLEQIKSHGEKAGARKDFALAGSTYDILLRNYPQFADFAHSLSFGADFLETRIKSSRKFLIEREAQPYLEEGDFQKVIDVYQEAYQQYPNDSMLRDNYLQNLEVIKQDADQAFEGKDFALSGRVYEILWRNYPHFIDLAPSLSFNEKYLEQRIQTSRKLLAEKQAHQHLTAGDFQKTIEIYKEIYQQNSKDAVVRRSYTKAIKAIKKNADQAFERKDFALAGRGYEILWRNYSHLTDMNPSLSWGIEFLNSRMQSCKTFLYEKALDQYRSGNLSGATAIWKSILEFDPENAEIQKAVDTATIQLRNLEKMK
jgi:tetratricopeptide (TPR) repeat protein